MPRKVKKPQPSERPGAISGTLLEFARPLLELHGMVDASEPPLSPAQIKETLTLAATIWNAVTLSGWHPETDFKDEIERAIEQMPGPISAAARVMMKDRVERFGDSDWAFGEISVVDDGRGGFTVRAEARGTAH